MRARSGWPAWAAVLLSMLCGTLNIPAVRPFFAEYYAADESLMHAFVGFHALGSALGGPLLTWISDRTARRRLIGALLALADGILLVLIAFAPHPAVLLFLRVVGGAVSVGALSILMGASSAKDDGTPRMGPAGAAVIAAIALGPPLGTMLLGPDVRGPFWGGAVAGLFAAILAFGFVASSLEKTPRANTSPWSLLRETPALRIAALWVGVERFAIGCFVVTFAIYAHDTLGLSDKHVGMLYSAFLIPFAIATWPAAKLASRGHGGHLLAGGGIVYALSFFSLGRFDATTTAAVLVLAGLASASIYAPCLQLSTASSPASLRATALGLVNASGTLGMLLGTVIAGAVGAALKARGVDKLEVCRVVFQVAGVVVLALAIASIRMFSALCVWMRREEAVRSTRSSSSTP